MNRLTPILICLLFYSFTAYGQTFEPIDSIDWSLSSDGDQSGVTPGFGHAWSAGTPGADPDGGTFAVMGNSFLIQDAEGTTGCDCDTDATTNCGMNDNTLFIPAAIVSGFCQVRVRMTVTSSGNLECGGTPEELIPGCPGDIGAGWEGTDAMTIQISAADLGDTEGHTICGEQGIGLVELTVDVSPQDAISLFITGGTQNADEFYSISNIVIEGVRRDINNLNLTLTTQPKINNSNIICENNGTPIKFQVAASANNATFQWTGPNGWVSSDASPEIPNYDPTWSGTYHVTVTDRNMCPIIDEIDVTVLESNDADCRPQALFANLFPTQCSDFTLPSTDDDGVTGTWSPSDNLSLFADSTLTFTFTPNDPGIGEYSQLIDVFDISESNRPASQPAVRPVFCNAVSDQVDLIQLFNMNLDYEITVQGDIALFDKITTGESINSVENEYRTFDFLGVEPGGYEFFVEALAPCQTAAPFLVSLKLTVVEQNPVILNESLCMGDYIDTLGYRIFGDTVITTGGACDTVVRATINHLQPGVRPASLPHPTGSQFFDCGGLFYFYGDEFSGNSRGVFAGGRRGEEPPLGPDFDTIFYVSYNGPFTLPYPASNGCDSIITIDLSLGNPAFTFDSIPLCPGMDTVVMYQGVPYTITEAEPLRTVRSERPGNECTIHEIRGVYATTQRDTIQFMLCASQDTIIEGQLFDINNPTETITLPPADGAMCPSLLFVDLTFDEPERGTLVISICDGDILTVGGIEFTESVTAMDIWLPTPASDGCDSIVTLTLTIQESMQETINPTVCSDSTFTFLGKDYDINNSTGMDTIRTAQGCDSIVYDINVEFYTDPLTVVLPDTSFCANSSVFYSEYNVTLDANLLSYDTVIITPNGCSQTVMFSGTLISVKDTMIQATICAGESFTLGTQTLTETTVATEVFTAASTGCDSTVTVELTVTEEIIVPLDISICAGAEYILGSQTLNTTGNYTEVFIAGAANGCDSTVNLNLTIMSPAEFPMSESICSGGSYDFNGRILTEANEYRDTLTASNTCDSIVILTLTVMEPEEFPVSVSICSGSSYDFNGRILTESNEYRDTLTASNTCDSIVILNFTVREPEEFPVSESICSGGSYDFNGRILTEANEYRDTLLSSSSCDSIVILTLTVMDPITTTFDDSTCDGLSYPWAGEFLTEAGSYPDTLMNSEGCDSIAILNLTITPAPVTEISATICEGETYDFDGDILSATGVYETDKVTVIGCDSLVRLTLTVNPIERTPLSESFSCAGASYSVGTNVYTTTGLYIDTLQSVNGCDSIVTLDLIIPDSIITPIDTFICEGDELILNADRLSTTGVHDVVYFASNGCDSIVRVNLEVLQPVETDMEVILCPGETILVFNNSFGNSTDREVTETEFFSQVGTSSRGCDSTVNLTLTRVAVGPPVLNRTICFNESFEVGTSSYTQSGFYRDTIISSFGCDSIVRLDLNVIPQYVSDISPTICTDGSFTVGDSVLTEAGFYAITIPTNANGCDSLVNVTLSIGDAFITDLSERICSGDDFIVGNSTYSASGMYSDTIQSFSGCDSIINLALTVLETQRTQLDTTICSGEVLDIAGNMFSTTTTDSVTILSVEGCDSLIIDLNLTVLNEINVFLPVEICAGESVQVGSSIYTTEGTFMDTLVASTGCDSTIRTVITILESISTTLTEQICTGGSFMVGTSSYTDSGSYTDTLTASAGCDSIVMLTLEVVDLVEEGIAATICSGESYSFAGQNLTTSGQYQDTLMSNLGCDSIVTLDLTVAPDLTIQVENIIGSCEGVANGTFVIRDISGATPPFAVSGLPGVTTIDMLPFTVTGLNPQTYNFDIADANGCTASMQVDITEDRSNALSIDAFTIDPTGIYDLAINFSGTIATIVWDNVPGLSCYDCLDPTANIIENTTFRVTVTDADGCQSTAEITLTTNSIGNIYMPNVFNPESSNGNHRFYIRGEDDSDAIYDLRIYDRWGNIMFETIGASINDPDFGWDGTKGGRMLNPDVYVYSGRVYDSNGSEQFINGDLTMLK